MKSLTPVQSRQASGLLVVAIMMAISPSIAAQNPNLPAFFQQKIHPLLVQHCYPCHSSEAEKLKGGLRLDSRQGWLNGGDSGESIIVPHNANESLLVSSVKHEGGNPMPPDYKLPASAIADIVEWINLGAPDPREDINPQTNRADKSWWSLQPLLSTARTEADKQDWSATPIDHFVDAKLADRSLRRNPPADPRVLIRRMTYDILGLPPTDAEVIEFTTAYPQAPLATVEKLVDRLLASPRYGEQWGRHWLDTIRFGESNGFERNVIIDDLWPFRDYVIKSINDDKPFNQFIIEHLAGDVIGKDVPDIEVGSAFLVAGPYDDVGNQDVVAQKNIRAATLDDMITATGSAFLGLTINCARCHHHKFDPIPTEDYYRMRAAFEGITHGRRVIASKEQRAQFTSASQPLRKELSRIVSEKEALDDAIRNRAEDLFAKQTPERPKIDVHGTDETFNAVQARFLKFIMHAMTSDFQAKNQPRSGAGRLTEFQVWSNEQPSRNVALASSGATAEGAKSAIAEDFPEAYGAQLTIDGQFGEQWFIGDPAVLTISFAKPETINRISFINAKGGRDIDESKVRGATPCEYEVQVSLDGLAWQTVATSSGREPWTPAHGIEQAIREVITADEGQTLATLEKTVSETRRKLSEVQPLPEVWAGNFSQPSEPTFVQKGGDPMLPLRAVSPASLSVLDELTEPYELAQDAPEGERRLALARWITSDRNALTARVLANRIWHYHFGTGIVDTPSDFGFLGSSPTHPELLDYLASRLIANQWKLKAIHREILLSQTYRQSSTFVDSAAQVDKDARLLWRFPPRRLSAEEIRDTMLSVAGVLEHEPMGGPGFRLYKFTQNNVCTYFPLDHHGIETYRRAVYHQNARASVVDLLNDFDLPDTAFASPKRATTTSPLQSLTLLNHQFTLDMASELSKRIAANATGLDAIPFIQSAYQIVFQRVPSPSEITAARIVIDEYGPNALCRAMFNFNELIFID
jgi:hypothetical protein